MAAKLRPGLIEFEDVRAAIASHLGDGVDSRELAERLLAEPALVDMLDEVNGRVEAAERAAQQAAFDKLIDVVTVFLRKEGLD